MSQVTVVSNLGVWFDAELSMRSHVTCAAVYTFSSSAPNTCRPYYIRRCGSIVAKN